MAEFNPEALSGAGNDGGNASGRFHCVKCAYYEVTWDPDNPRGCIMFGFKSRKMPCEVVLESTGKPCPSFTPVRKNGER